MSGLFSKIANGEIGAYKVAEDENYLAFLDIFPLQKGHTLVIPKKETDYIFDLDDREYSGLMLFAKEVAVKIKKVIPCNRIGVTVIGLEVPHAHVHLIPISKERDMNFSNSKLKLSEEEFESIAKMIRKA
ncbi:MAG: HIT family protein [Bacteroidetes bacterium]|nr:MAG: HIT family protein [Bacteroidota bacterium]